MSQPYAESFLETCFDAGLNEQEAARLLQKQSVDLKKKDSPGFAAGYDETMAKEAKTVATKGVLGSLGEAFGHAWDAAKAVGRGGRAAGSNLGKATGKVANPKNPESFITKHPGLAALGAAGTAAAGTYGLNRMRDGYSIFGDDIRLSPGAFSPGAYDREYDGMMDTRYGPDIFAHNKALQENQRKLDELQARNDDGSLYGIDYKRMKELERENAIMQKKQKRHFSGLDRIHNESTALMDEVAKKTQSLEDLRGSWSPRGIYHRIRAGVTGRDTGDYFDDRIAELKDQARQARMRADLAEERRQLLASGATTRNPENPPPQEEIQRRFFDTYE